MRRLLIPLLFSRAHQGRSVEFEGVRGNDLVG
jgi:hypothetical protein